MVIILIKNQNNFYNETNNKNYLYVNLGQITEGRQIPDHLSLQEYLGLPVILPDKADVFVAYATVPGYR